MAERRMFTKKIIDSDAFLDMPLSTQALYFHLNMRADDDGFVNNPKKICRMIGASEDDLKVLISKRFVLTFNNGVIVIKHWRMHNLLRKDRYKPTQYQEQFKEIELKTNGAYTEKRREPLKIEGSASTATNWQPDGNQLATQDRVGKDRIDKVSLDKVSGRIGSNDNNIYNTIIQLYNDLCPSFPPIRSISGTRMETVNERLGEYDIQAFCELFEKAEASDFLKGKNDRGWVAPFDWLIKRENMEKVLEGGCDDWKPKKKAGFQNFIGRDYDMPDLERKIVE